MKPNSGLKIAIVGATGVVGKEMLDVLCSRKFPIRDLVLFASLRSEGKKINFDNKFFTCQTLKPRCFEGVDIAFFDASDDVSKEWVPSAAQAGAWVVDNSAVYRLNVETPLIVPEVNRDVLLDYINNNNLKIISGPNCTVAPLVVTLKPILENFGLKRVVLSTYQSVSGAGSLAMNELKSQTQAFLNKNTFTPQIFPHPIAFNCLPHIGSFKEDGYTSEEHKTVNETRKILNIMNLKMTTTSVRVPTLNCHAESVNIECEKPWEMKTLLELLSKQEGISVLDDPSHNVYPLGINVTGKNPVFVGRIRKDTSAENALNLWLVSDNLRKGAALNAIQIGEILAEKVF